MKSVSFAVALVAVLALPVAADEGANRPWTDTPIVDSAQEFHFAIIADNAGGPRPRVLEDAVGKLNLLRPAFVMTVGDLISGYKQDQAELDAEWGKLLDIIKPLRARLYFVPGNHEVSNPFMAADFERRFGRLYYHFTYQNVLFLCLNSQDGPYGGGYPSAISDAQVEYVRRALEENHGVRWTFVFMHQPLWDTHGYSNTGWEKVQAMLAGKPHTVFAGHYHRYGKHEVDGYSYIRLATTGGDSRLSGAREGEFDHIAWVTMAGEGPVIANLGLEGVYTDDVSIDLSERAWWSVNWRWPVVASSTVTESPTVSSVTIPVRFENITDVPMSAKVNVTAAGESMPRLELERTVEPGRTESAEAVIEYDKPLVVADAGPILVDWEVAYPIPGRETVTGRRIQKVIIEPVHKVERLAAPMKVDGDLSDWGGLPFRLEEPAEVSNEHRKPWRGAGDASCRFGVASDGQFLYVGVEAQDDAHSGGIDLPVRQCDGVSILVDPRERLTRNQDASGGLRQINIDISPASGGGEPRVGLGKTPTSKAVVSATLTARGYNVELAVPLSLLDELRGGGAPDFRFNLCIHDRDDETEYNHLWWRPFWGGPYDYADSGMFRLE